MLSALAVVACLADPGFTPTPTLRVDPGPACATCTEPVGVRLYYANADAPAGTWEGAFSVPFEAIPGSVYTGGEMGAAADPPPCGTPVVVPCSVAPITIRRVVELDWPLQRATDAEGTLMRVMFKFYDEANRESAGSNQLDVCLPEVWP